MAQEVPGGLTLSGRGSQSPVVVLVGNYKLRLSYENVESMTSGRVHEFSVTLREVRGTCNSDSVTLRGVRGTCIVNISTQRRI